MVRHWDQWIDPRKRTQIFAVDIQKNAQSGSWFVTSAIRNLMQHTKLESPVGPLGDATDFSVSRNYVVFTAKDPDVPHSWHTRQQMYLVPINGRAPPGRMNINEGRGWAGTPAISPNEDVVVFLQQHKDGFESDHKLDNLKSWRIGTFPQHRSFFRMMDTLYTLWCQRTSSVSFTLFPYVAEH